MESSDVGINELINSTINDVPTSDGSSLITALIEDGPKIGLIAIGGTLVTAGLYYIGMRMNRGFSEKQYSKTTRKCIWKTNAYVGANLAMIVLPGAILRFFKNRAEYDHIFTSLLYKNTYVTIALCAATIACAAATYVWPKEEKEVRHALWGISGLSIGTLASPIALIPRGMLTITSSYTLGLTVVLSAVSCLAKNPITLNLFGFISMASTSLTICNLLLKNWKFVPILVLPVVLTNAFLLLSNMHILIENIQNSEEEDLDPLLYSFGITAGILKTFGEILYTIFEESTDGKSKKSKIASYMFRAFTIAQATSVANSALSGVEHTNM
eukprot:TRINITY_DN6044_c0_g1_i1.p1 TRINITY_DN6044_c0_g1~~TRINITY_DN6044_c0_g1_i1.p1  ORF type:complete len:327 (-),score=27.60 TRINITY_DN6044_c0_g1_i1:141-1121(-)